MIPAKYKNDDHDDHASFLAAATSQRRRRRRLESLRSGCPCHSYELKPLFQGYLPESLEYHVYAFLDTSMLTILQCCSKGVQPGLHYYMAHLQRHHYEWQLPPWICKGRHIPRITHLSVKDLPSHDSDDHCKDHTDRDCHRGHRGHRGPDNVHILSYLVRENAHCLSSLCLENVRQLNPLLDLLLQRQVCPLLPLLETLVILWPRHYLDIETRYRSVEWPKFLAKCPRLSTLRLSKLFDVGHLPLNRLHSLAIGRIDDLDAWTYFEKAMLTKDAGILTFSSLQHLSLHVQDGNQTTTAFAYLRAFGKVLLSGPGLRSLTRLDFFMNIYESPCRCPLNLGPVDCSSVEWTFPNLERLDFEVFWCCGNPFTPPTIVAPQLVHLDFHESIIIADPILKDIFVLGRYPHLQTFYAPYALVSDSNGVSIVDGPTPVAGDTTVYKPTRLTDLKSSMCFGLSLFHTTPHLKHLDLFVSIEDDFRSNDDEFTATIVRYLEPFASSLETFHCRSCYKWGWDSLTHHRRDEHHDDDNASSLDTRTPMRNLYTIAINKAAVKMQDWLVLEHRDREDLLPCARVNLRILTRRLTFPRLVSFAAMLSPKADTLDILGGNHHSPCPFAMVSSAYIWLRQEEREVLTPLFQPRPLRDSLPPSSSSSSSSSSTLQTVLSWKETHLLMDPQGHWLRLLSWVAPDVLHTLCLQRHLPSSSYSVVTTTPSPRQEWDQLTTTLLTRISEVVGRSLRHLYLSMALYREEWPLVIELASTERYFPNLMHLYLPCLPAHLKSAYPPISPPPPRDTLLRRGNPHFTVHFYILKTSS